MKVRKDNVLETQPVSGTVASNQGTPNAGGALAWPVSLDGLPDLAHGQFDVTISEVGLPAAALAGRKTIVVKALTANGAEIFVGLAGVSTTNGFELSAGDGVEVDSAQAVTLRFVSSSGTQRACYIEVA